MHRRSGREWSRRDLQAPAVAAPPEHDRIVNPLPQTDTPNVQDESVDAIYDAGQKVIAAGEFTSVRSIGANQDDLRKYIFAFDEDTGVVDQAFAPFVDGVVSAVIAGPTAGTVFIGGRFTAIGEDDPATTADERTKRSKVALLNVADGSVVATFNTPVINGQVTDLALVGDRLIVAGAFTKVGPGETAPVRQGLASFNATTGALDEYLTVGVTENHSWTTGSTNAKAPVGVDKIAVSPDGSKLVAIGNFKKANGVLHDQVLKLDLGATSATIADWNTNRYEAVCAPDKFDSYVRDVAFSPDNSYFVVVTTGTGVANTLCDSAARWSSTATGTAVEPTWIAYSGGDTLLSVAISEQVVYVGGHVRWMNNPLGRDGAGAGAVGRASIAALDPLNGLPTAWNPGRNPRGYGITELHLTPQGLWIGHDQEYIGNQEYKHDRIAFFPLAGGKATHSTATRSLPGNVYQLGANAPAAALFRINAGGETITSADGGPNWQADTLAAPSRYHNAGMRHNAGRPFIENMLIPPISARTPREIFGSELVSSGTAPNINWDIPIAKGTKITVRMYFSTRCGCAAGTRKFNINIDGVRKVSNYDPTAAAGGDGIGTALSYNVTSDGNVDIDMLKVLGSPVVNAIEIVRNPAPAMVGTENFAYKRTYNGDTDGGREDQDRHRRHLPLGGWPRRLLGGRHALLRPRPQLLPPDVRRHHVRSRDVRQPALGPEVGQGADLLRAGRRRRSPASSPTSTTSW